MSPHRCSGPTYSLSFQQLLSHCGLWSPKTSPCTHPKIRGRHHQGPRLGSAPCSRQQPPEVPSRLLHGPVLHLLGADPPVSVQIHLGEDDHQLPPALPRLCVLLKVTHVLAQEDLLVETFVEVPIHLQLHPIQVVWGQDLIFLLPALSRADEWLAGQADASIRRTMPRSQRQQGARPQGAACLESMAAGVCPAGQAADVARSGLPPLTQDPRARPERPLRLQRAPLPLSSESFNFLLFIHQALDKIFPGIPFTFPISLTPTTNHLPNSKYDFYIGNL